MKKSKCDIGRIFGRLKILGPAGYRSASNGHRNALQLCQCECGRIVEILQYKLLNGHTRSCGCLQKDRASAANTKHGFATPRARVYRMWQNMVKRCTNPNTPNYHRYGGRGITVFDPWRESGKFIEWALANGYADDLQIDRIDNEGNYEPSNCRFVSNAENSRNSSFCKIDMETAEKIRELYSLGGVTHDQLAKKYGIDRSTVTCIVANKIWKP